MAIRTINSEDQQQLTTLITLANLYGNQALQELLSFYIYNTYTYYSPCNMGYSMDTYTSEPQPVTAVTFTSRPEAIDITRSNTEETASSSHKSLGVLRNKNLPN